MNETLWIELEASQYSSPSSACEAGFISIINQTLGVTIAGLTEGAAA